MDTHTQPNSTLRGGPTYRKRPAAGKAIGAVVIIVLVGSVWIGHDLLNGSPAAAAAPEPPQVTVSTPLSRDLNRRLGFVGQLSAVDNVELRAQVGGTLTGIHFTDGAMVHKGDLLFTVDPEPYEIRLARAKAELESATARVVLADSEFRRAQELRQSEAGTVQNVEQRQSEQRAALAAVDGAKAELRDAQFDVDHCHITAPFNGRIGRHLASIGNQVAGSRTASASSTLLATLVSLDPIHLDFDVSEPDFEAFSRYRAEAKTAGPEKVEVAFNGGENYNTEATLDFVDNAIDRSSGTIHVRATVANPDLALTPGSFARLRLVVARPVPTLLLPDAAVLPDQSEHMVLTVGADGAVAAKKVELGELRGGLRVIRSGLSPTDKVVIDGIPFAAPGSKVNPRAGSIAYADSQD